VIFTAVSALVVLMTACRAPKLPSFETSSGGWNVVTGQAIWTPRAGAEAVAGDYLLATHPDGRLMIDFSKGSMSIAVVRCARKAWRLEVPIQGQAFGGRGLPPARSSWLVLARDLAVQPPPPDWHFQSQQPGVLSLRCTVTGESLELYRWVP
jgi:hypothetical protein